MLKITTMNGKTPPKNIIVDMLLCRNNADKLVNRYSVVFRNFATWICLLSLSSTAHYYMHTQTVYTEILGSNQ